MHRGLRCTCIHVDMYLVVQFLPTVLNQYKMFQTSIKLLNWFQRPVTAYERWNCTNVHTIDSWFKKSDHVMTNFMIEWWVNLLPSGKVLHSLFASLLRFALSSKILWKICYKEDLDRCKIHRMDKICLELDTFEEFATAVLQTVAKRCLSSRDHFFQSAAATNGTCNGLKKSHFNRRLGSIVQGFKQTTQEQINKHWKTNFLSWL